MSCEPRPLRPDQFYSHIVFCRISCDKTPFREKKRESLSKWSLIFPRLYVIFHRTIMDEQRGLSSKMNGNTADLYWMPLEGGGGTVCLIPIAWPVETCRFAGGGDAALVSSLTLDRYEGAGANGVSAFAQSRAEQSRAEHLTQSSSAEARRTVASEKHFPISCELPTFTPCASGRRALPQRRRLPATSIPHETSFLTPPAPIFPAQGGFFVLIFPDFELKST